MLQTLINTAFSNGFGGSGFSFVITMRNIFGETKRFYFHEAHVENWETSVWEHWATANPKRFTIVSKSGLTLKYIERYGLRVINPNRPTWSRTKRAKDECECIMQSLVDRTIAFVRA